MKAGPERELAERYVTRAGLAGRSLGLKILVRELDESRARRPEDRKAEEGAAVRGLVASGSRQSFLFEETGEALDSAAFAQLLRAALDEGGGTITFVIGGPDGLDPSLRAEATRALSFGAMTWPHQIVRILAAEQIYRATTILTGHPYHRA